MITCYFGVPRVGKTTILAKEGVKAIRKLELSFSHYDHVYSNFFLLGAEKIDFSDLGIYKIKNSLILLDELTVDADCRDHKNFDSKVRDFIIYHGHLFNDIIYATQDFSSIDKKIRDLTHELWYMEKSVLPLFKEFTTAKRIYRNININENTSELTLGYRFCNFIESIFVSNLKICYRKPYYKYFDSYCEGPLLNRPEFVSVKWSDSVTDLPALFPSADVLDMSDITF